MMNRAALALSLALSLVACSATPNVDVTNIIQVSGDGGATDAAEVVQPSADAAPEADASDVADALADASTVDASELPDAHTDAETESHDADLPDATDAASPSSIACTVAGASFDSSCAAYPSQGTMYFCTDGNAGAACPSADRLVMFSTTDGTSWCCGA